MISFLLRCIVWLVVFVLLFIFYVIKMTTYSTYEDLNNFKRKPDRIKEVIGYSFKKQIDSDREEITCTKINFEGTDSVTEQENDDFDDTIRKEKPLWTHVPGTNLFVFSAYWDHRLETVTYVRIIGMIKGFEDQQYYCQRLSSKGRYYIRKAKLIHIWSKNWDKEKEAIFNPVLLSCLITIEERIASLSLHTKPCTVSNVSLNIKTVNRTEVQDVQTVPRITVCVKPLNFNNDISRRLMQWIEINNILGASKFIIFVESVHSNVMKLLKFYENKYKDKFQVKKYQRIENFVGSNISTKREHKKSYGRPKKFNQKPLHSRRTQRFRTSDIASELDPAFKNTSDLIFKQEQRNGGTNRSDHRNRFTKTKYDPTLEAFRAAPVQSKDTITFSTTEQKGLNELTVNKTAKCVENPHAEKPNDTSGVHTETDVYKGSCNKTGELERPTYIDRRMSTVNVKGVITACRHNKNDKLCHMLFSKVVPSNKSIKPNKAIKPRSIKYKARKKVKRNETYFSWKDILRIMIHTFKNIRLNHNNKIFQNKKQQEPSVETNNSEIESNVQRHAQIFNSIPRSQYWGIWQKRKNEVVTYNDCFYSSLYSSEFVLPIDIDEIIVPKEHYSWQQLLTETLDLTSFQNSHQFSSHPYFPASVTTSLSTRKKITFSTFQPITSTISSFSVRNAYFLEVFGTQDVLEPVFFFRYRRRSQLSAVGESTKSFIATKNTLTVFNHYSLESLKPGTLDEVYFLSDNLVQMNHYRHTCNVELLPECAKYLDNKDTIVDAVMEKYRKHFDLNYNESLAQFDRFCATVERNDDADHTLG